MTEIVHTETVRGYRIDILRDPEPSTPREWCQNGLILLDESRADTRNSAQPDALAWLAVEGKVPAFPPTVACLSCKGTGADESAKYGECAECDGMGEREASRWPEIVAYYAERYGATTVLALDGPHDWAGVLHVWPVDEFPRVAGGAEPLPRFVTGVIFDTAERRAETGTKPEQMPEALRGEIAEYNQYADGDVYAFRVSDCNGEPVPDGELYGIYGNTDDPTLWTYALTEARDMVPEEPCERLYSARFTRGEWALVWRGTLAALGSHAVEPHDELLALSKRLAPLATGADGAGER